MALLPCNPDVAQKVFSKHCLTISLTSGSSSPTEFKLLWVIKLDHPTLLRRRYKSAAVLAATPIGRPRHGRKDRPLDQIDFTYTTKLPSPRGDDDNDILRAMKDGVSYRRIIDSCSNRYERSVG